MASTSGDPTAAAAALEHEQQHEHAPQRQWPQRSRAEKLAYRHAKRDAARRAFAREVGDDEQGRAAQTSVSLARDAGLRLVAPYWFTHHSFVKGVWVGRSVATLQRAYCLGLMADEGAAERDGAPDEAVLRRWLELGRLRVNGSCAHPDGAHASFADLLLRSGDKLAHTVHLHEPPVRLWDPARPSPELLRVLREQEALGVRDDDAIVRAAVPTTRVGAVVVADKPSSLPVHPAGKYRHNSLTLLLQRHCAYGTLHPIHRLDRLTSGLTLLTADTLEARRLQALMKSGQLRKTYLARCHGHLLHDVTVDQPILVDRLRGCSIDAQGKAALTRFTYLAHDAHTTLLRCEPMTGRMHQIRLHLHHLGHPIVGDPLYVREGVERTAALRLPAGQAPLSPDAVPDCPDCVAPFVDGTHWEMCLHAMRYESPADGLCFEIERLPWWASDSLVDPPWAVAQPASTL